MQLPAGYGDSALVPRHAILFRHGTTNSLSEPPWQRASAEWKARQVRHEHSLNSAVPSAKGKPPRRWQPEEDAEAIERRTCATGQTPEYILANQGVLTPARW